MLELQSFTLQPFVGIMKIRLHAPESMVGNATNKTAKRFGRISPRKMDSI